MEKRRFSGEEKVCRRREGLLDRGLSEREPENLPSLDWLPELKTRKNLDLNLP